MLLILAIFPPVVVWARGFALMLEAYEDTGRNEGSITHGDLPPIVSHVGLTRYHIIVCGTVQLGSYLLQTHGLVDSPFYLASYLCVCMSA